MVCAEVLGSLGGLVLVKTELRTTIEKYDLTVYS